MPSPPKIVIVDKSELARNIYFILLSPLGAPLIIKRRFEEAKPHFYRHENVKLAIFNTNIFGKQFDEITKRISDEEPLRNMEKIFLCKDSPIEAGCKGILSRIANSTILTRPFHPDEFTALVKKLLS